MSESKEVKGVPHEQTSSKAKEEAGQAIKHQPNQEPKKASPFANLKTTVLNALKGKAPEPQSRPQKIDMAFLKETLKESLKDTGPRAEARSRHKRVPTGIEGFDQLIEGGLIEKSITLLTGGPGSGKSIFAMQYLINGIDQHNENGIYISFEEEPETLLTDMQRFNWNVEDKIKNNKLAILYYSPEQVDRVISIGGGPVREVIESLGAKRIVIDSVSAFTLLYKTENDQRRALIQLFKALKKWDCTSILISEQTLTPSNHISTVEEYQAEGVVFIYHTKSGDIRERSIEVFKMRATNHSAKIFPLKISGEGITVYPDQNVY